MVTMADKRIVVGVDGSPSSMKALRWAIRQAKLTGAEVEAVTAWSYPSGYGWAPFSDGAVDLEGDAGKILAEALAEVSGIAPDVVIEPLAAYGHAADVLGARGQGCRPARGQQPGPRRVRRNASWLGQPALRASCSLPRSGPARREVSGAARPPGPLPLATRC